MGGKKSTKMQENEIKRSITMNTII